MAFNNAGPLLDRRHVIHHGHRPHVRRKDQSVSGLLGAACADVWVGELRAR
jgi:hypothetical protein